MPQSSNLKVLLSNDPIAAISLFDETIQGEDDEVKIEEVCRLMANYIRHSSVYKRKIMCTKLCKTSLLCRLYLSFQFRSFNDTVFPRRLIFKGRCISHRTPPAEPKLRHLITAVGFNRYFNLGVQSDGSPVEEPRLVSVPSVKDMKMSNTHTIFLSDDNELFGCGKVASFLPNGIEEKDGGYVALPTAIEIPEVPPGEEVSEIRVSEGGSQFLIGEHWYFIGKCPQLPNIRKIASNCFVTMKEDFTPPAEHLYAVIPLEEDHVKVYVGMVEGCLYWDRTPDFSGRKEVQFIVNGCYISYARCFNHFQVLNDGTIYVTKFNLLKGKLQFWKNIDDGFIVRNGTVRQHYDTKYTLMALMEEVPGTLGTVFFTASPDGRNIVMKTRNQHARTARDEAMEFKSPQTHLIIKERLEKECDPVDIPIDLTLCFYKDDRRVGEYGTNSVVFGMMYPEWTTEIQNNELHFRADHPPSSRIELTRGEYTFHRDSDDQLPPPAALIMEFVPEGTDPSLICELVTTDRVRVPCHQYLLLIHSRRMAGLQRFQSNLVYGLSYCLQEEPRDETMEILAETNADVVRNALRGMLNPVTLFQLRTIELIECINFYDYHLMQEMFHDAMFILMETTNDFTLHYLYDLFISFEDSVVDGLCERPNLLFNSILTVPPPRPLLLKFVEMIEDIPTGNPGHERDLIGYNPEVMLKYFLDLDHDHEDVLWRSVHEDFTGMLDKWKQEALHRREVKKAVRSRNNSHTYRPETSSDSAPIPIGNGRHNSFSDSFGTPTQSPSTFSMSPLVRSFPTKENRSNSISKSFEDFPEMGRVSALSSSTSTPNKMKSPGGRFAPKGARFVKANEILQPIAAPNPWKVSSGAIQEEETPTASVNFQDVIQKEEKLQKNLRTGFKKVLLLPHIETEQVAGAEILEMYRRDYQEEALICVELVLSDEQEVDSEQIVWGNMPGLLRR